MRTFGDFWDPFFHVSEGVSVGDIKAVDGGHDSTIEELIKGGKLVFASRVPE